MNASSQPPEDGAPENLERSADRIRADLDRTLGALERRLAPSQLLDRSLSYLREHGGDMTRSVGDAVRRNPVPIMITIAGLGWLVASSIHKRNTIDVTPSNVDLDREEFEGDEFSSDRLGSESQGLRGKVRNRVAAARNRTRQATRQAQYRAVSAVEESPLLFGGLAIAIGALLGAVIPSTDYEDRVVGQVRDRAVERAKEMGERQYQNLRSRFEDRDLEVSGQAH
ncbi:MAG TPA: DUF3618 domain-containing protein [Steroidobacteraceae bacterium]|nr:DUF3618 domain-containing protein [Steroidobacteraceae bacterium]